MKIVCWASLISLIACVFLAGISAAIRDGTSERQMFHKPIVDLRTHSGVFDQVSGAISNKSCIFVSGFATSWNGAVPLSPDPQFNTVSNILRAQKFSLENLNRFQLRVFKRQQILQTPFEILPYEENLEAQAVAGTELVPGDVVVIVGTGM